MDSKQAVSACYIRWMIRRDMPEVLAIESSCFEFPWSEDDFILCLRNRNRIGMVAERGERVIGFMIYELHRNRLHILNLAVHPDFRRMGVGHQMAGKLIGKLSPQRRRSLSVHVRESNLDAQLFFRAMGLKAIDVIRDFYSSTNEDAYLFEYRQEGVSQ